MSDAPHRRPQCGAGDLACAGRIACATPMAIALMFAAGVTHAQLTLVEVVDRALAYSPDLRALQAGVAEAAANTMMAQAAFRPAATISTTPGYATGLPIAVLGSVPAIGTVEARSLLFNRAARAEVLEAKAQMENAATQLDTRRRDVAQAAVDLYARYAADEGLVAAAKRRLASNETILSRTDALRREGRARDLDYDRAALQASAARRGVLQAQTRLELDELRLRRLIDWPADRPLRVSTDSGGQPPTAVLNTVGIVAERDPELRSLSLQIAELQRAMDLQKRWFQPTVEAQVQYSRLFDRYSRFYLNFKPDDFSVGTSIAIPLWNGGRQASAVARVAAQLERLIAERDARRATIEIDARAAESDLREALAEQDLAAHMVSVAREALRIAQVIEQEGRGEPNDVAQAEVSLAEAEEQTAEAGIHLVSARGRLLVLRGELPRRSAGE